MQYIDGIDDFSYRDGVVRGTLVILELKTNSESVDSPQEKSKLPNIKTTPVGSIAMPLKAAIQIHAALGELMNRLVENKVIAPADKGPSEIIN